MWGTGPAAMHPEPSLALACRLDYVNNEATLEPGTCHSVTLITIDGTTTRATLYQSDGATALPNLRFPPDPRAE